jgi:hypothetical protein
MTVIVNRQESRSVELGRGAHVSNMCYACHNVTAWYTNRNFFIRIAYFFPIEMKSESSLNSLAFVN